MDIDKTNLFDAALSIKNFLHSEKESGDDEQKSDVVTLAKSIIRNIAYAVGLEVHIDGDE